MARARQVLESYRDFTHSSPDELTLACAVLTPSGSSSPIIGMLACYCGDLSEGERVLAPLRSFGPPLVDRIQPMPYAGLFALLDPSVPAGRSYHMKGGGMQELSDGAIDALLDSAEGLTSPYSQIGILPVHGAASRVGASETAFSFREEHYEFFLMASWDDDGQERHVQWTRQSYQMLQRFASQRAYVNFLDDEGAARVRAAYWPNYDRLVELKTKYDPDNVFHLNQNIKPAPTCSAG